MSEAYAEAIARARALDGPLEARLALVRAAVRGVAPGLATLIDGFVARLAEAGAGGSAPDVGDSFPDFALPDHRGRLLSLSERLAGGPVALAFFRGGWCDYCSLALRALAEAEPRVAAAGGAVLAVSPQRGAWALGHRADAAAAFPMLADIGCGVATTLGLTVRVDDPIARMLEGFGIDLADRNADPGGLLPIPATFVLAPGARVVARFVEPDFRRRMEPAAVVRAIRDAAASGDAA